ncbi:hypothetical protein V8E36_005620 [Tilletia maclaganii]
MSELYPYPQSNSDLIGALKLEPHPEGGYYALSWLGEEQGPTPFVKGRPDRGLASTIYYLLAPRSQAQHEDAEKHLAKNRDVPVPAEGQKGSEAAGQEKFDREEASRIKWSPHQAVFHCNRSATMHLHHAGRAKYTLIEAHPRPGSRPRIKEVIVGADLAAGETRQLLVEGGDAGWWKMSAIPEADLPRTDDKEDTAALDNEQVGCLISEVVIPSKCRATRTRTPWSQLTCSSIRELPRLFFFRFRLGGPSIHARERSDELFGDDEASVTRFLPFVVEEQQQ